MQQPTDNLRERCKEWREGYLVARPEKRPVKESYSKSIGKDVYSYYFELRVNGKKVPYEFITDGTVEGEFSKVPLAPLMGAQWGAGSLIKVHSFPNSWENVGKDGNTYLNVNSSRAIDFDLIEDAATCEQKRKDWEAKQNQPRQNKHQGGNTQQRQQAPTRAKQPYQPTPSNVPSFSPDDFDDELGF